MHNNRQLHFALVVYEHPATVHRTEKIKLEHSIATPLDQDDIPVHHRMMKSPLLVKQHKDSPWSTSGHDPTKEFSVWSLSLTYPSSVRNVDDFHNLDSDALMIEFHTVTNLSTPLPSLPSPRNSTLRFRYVGKASSHFYLVNSRYTRSVSVALHAHKFHSLAAVFPDMSVSARAVCSLSPFMLSTIRNGSVNAGTMCLQHTETSRNMHQHSLYPTHSPVCVPNTKAVNWTIAGPEFQLLLSDGSIITPPSSVLVHHIHCDNCVSSIVTVTFGRGESSARYSPPQREVVVTGPGRHRVLSVISALLRDSSIGFLLLKSYRASINVSDLIDNINNYDLLSNTPFIAFRKRRIRRQDMDHGPAGQDDWTPLPDYDFGSFHDGILLSRAAAILMLQAAIEESSLDRNDTLPAACSEHLIFSDAWLCWCAADLEIPALDMQFTAAPFHTSDCSSESPLYRKLVHLYEQQRISDAPPLSPQFTERTTLGFQYFMQTVAFHPVSGPHILSLPDNEDEGDSFLWDACSSGVLVHHMRSHPSLPVNTALHPVIQRIWDSLSTAPNRSAFVSTLRDAITSAALDGLASVNSSLPAVRRRLRLSVSATRVLGCSVQQAAAALHSEDLLLGSSDSGDGVEEQLRMSVVTPAVLLLKHGRPVSKRFYLATQNDWSLAFGYNPLFTKDASKSYTAPNFSLQDWHLICMLAVSSIQGRISPEFDGHSREYYACSAFASAVAQRSYSASMPRCFDLPPQSAGFMRYGGWSQAHAEYLKRCLSLSNLHVNDDPWMLRELASSVRELLFERWDLLQVWHDSCWLRFEF
jgi:hypothetical protein